MRQKQLLLEVSEKACCSLGSFSWKMTEKQRIFIFAVRDMQMQNKCRGSLTHFIFFLNTGNQKERRLFCLFNQYARR